MAAFGVTRVIGVTMPVICQFASGLNMDCTIHELQLVRRIIKVEFNVVSLSAFFLPCPL